MPLGKPLLDVLDSMGYGGLLLDGECRVLRFNMTAHALLTGHVRSDDKAYSLSAPCLGFEKILRTWLGSKSEPGEQPWIAVSRDELETSRPLIIRVVPVQTDDATVDLRVVMIVDLNGSPRPSAEVLRRIFQLTPSEARLAIDMASGRGLDAIAQSAQVSIGTVRKQLATVFAKTNTHRQAELVALMARLAILP